MSLTMKKLLLILLCLPMIGFGQTYVPDDNFENYLEANGMGNGIANDDYVTTANINTINTLDVENMNIASLVGIEDFASLQYLYCGGNQLTFLDVSNNISLEYLHCPENNITTINFSNCVNISGANCEDNQITSLDISQNGLLRDLELKNNNLSFLNLKNGENILFYHIRLTDNPNLTCITVDDSLWSANNWTIGGNIDPQHYFSNNCSGTGIEEHATNKELIKITDLLGRETNQTNQPLFYIYDDGTVEKRIVIE